ncbi:MAG: hypothetical protein IJ247_05610 [Bacilli bacterium]|nr:hypothetical protein [Bacilli bacterium]
MKNNKLILLSLPAILVLASCHDRITPDSTPVESSSEISVSSSEPSSSSSSSSSSTSTGPTEEEKREEANGMLLQMIEKVNAGSYAMEYGGQSTRNLPDYIFTPTSFARRINTFIENYGNTDAYEGYFAFDDGLIHAGSGSFNYYGGIAPLGYSAKTSSLEEALEYLNEVQPEKLTLSSDEWEYVYNTENSVCFKGGDNTTKERYASLINDDASFYEDMYMYIDKNMSTLRLSPVIRGSETFSHYCELSTFNVEDLEDKDRGFYFYGELRRNAGDFYGSDGTSFVTPYRYEAMNYLPFPTAGDKYYFYKQNFYSQNRGELEIRFINTGDISDAFGAELESSGYFTEVEENKYAYFDYNFYSDMRDGILMADAFTFELSYLSADEVDRGDVYTQGIFTIKCNFESIDARTPGEWSSAYMNRFYLQELPFPSGITDNYLFYETYSYEWSGDRGVGGYRIEFPNSGDLTSSYEQQLLNEGYFAKNGKYVKKSSYYDYTSYNNNLQTYASCTATLGYDSASDTFSIEYKNVYDNLRPGDRWSDADMEYSYGYLYYLPFPTNGSDDYTANEYYSIYASFDFRSTGNIISSYEQQLFERGWQWSNTYSTYYIAVESDHDNQGIYSSDENWKTYMTVSVSYYYGGEWNWPNGHFQISLGYSNYDTSSL